MGLDLEVTEDLEGLARAGSGQGIDFGLRAPVSELVGALQA